MNEYCVLPRSPKPEPHNYIHFSVVPRIHFLWGECTPLQRIHSICSKPPTLPRQINRSNGGVFDTTESSRILLLNPKLTRSESPARLVSIISFLSVFNIVSFTIIPRGLMMSHLQHKPQPLPLLFWSLQLKYFEKNEISVRNERERDCRHLRRGHGTTYPTRQLKGERKDNFGGSARRKIRHH